MEHHGHMHTDGKSEPFFKLAFSATLHCLLGCGLGEVLGVIVGRILGMTNVSTLVLAVLLGFVFGFGLGLWPLLRGGFRFAEAVKIVLVAEGLSIAVMETAEVLVEVYTPGVMGAALTDGIFWLGILAALTAGFAAAFPVNLILVKNGIQHQH